MRSLFLLFIFFISNSIISQNHIWKVEPPNWWVDMPNHNLQLMIYGDEVGKRRPVIDNEGVIIKRYSSDKNINYLFIDLVIGDLDQALDFNIKFYYEEQLIDEISYSLKERRSLNNLKKPKLSSSDAIYLLNTDRFFNGDVKNDRIKGLKDNKINRNKVSNRHGGDIQGVLNQLDYIKEMGFTAISLNPLLTNDVENDSYLGFSCTDMYAIDPRFGSNKLYQNLSFQCQEKGIKLFKDIVLNHISNEHWWLSDLPTKKWLNNEDEFKLSNERLGSLFDPYGSKLDSYNYVSGWVSEDKPDLNQSNKYLSKYLVQNAVWWVEFAGLSGLRVPYFSYLDKSFFNRWILEVQKYHPGLSIIADGKLHDKSSYGLFQKSNSKEEKINQPVLLKSKPSNISFLLDYPLQHSMVNSISSNKNKGNYDLSLLYKNLVNDYLYSEPNNMIVFLDDNTLSRSFSQFNHDFDIWKMAFSYLMVTRGIPQIYYGTEILLSDSLRSGKVIGQDLDFPGGWRSDKVSGFNKNGLNQSQIEAQIFLKKMLNWRKGNEVLHDGKLMHFAPSKDQPFYCLVRYNKEKMVLLFMNNDDKKRSIILKNYINEVPSKAKNGIAVDVFHGNEIDVNDKQFLEKGSVLLFEYFF